MASPESVGSPQTPETPRAGDALYFEESLRALMSAGVGAPAVMAHLDFPTRACDTPLHVFSDDGSLPLESQLDLFWKLPKVREANVFFFFFFE